MFIRNTQSAEVDFMLGFPATGITIADHDRALQDRFSSVGRMSKVVDYVVKNESPKAISSLGVLTTQFQVWHGEAFNMGVTPIGASDSVLLGHFDLHDIDRRHRALEEDDVVNLFGTPARIEHSTTGYVALDRASMSAAGFGVMKYAGKAAVFNCAPNSESLFNFARVVVPDITGFAMARTDLCASAPERF